MKKILFSIFIAFFAQSMLAMEPIQKAKSQAEQIALDTQLIETIDELKRSLPRLVKIKIKKLLDQGANPNAIVAGGQNNATTQVYGNQGEASILMLCVYDPDLAELLIDAGANLFYKDARNHNATPLLSAAHVGNRGNFKTVSIIISSLVQLRNQDKGVVKNWLLLSKKLKTEHGISIPIELRKYIADHIVFLFVPEIQKKLVRAGIHRVASFNNEINKLVQNCLNVQFLGGLIRTQVLFPKK